MNIKNTHPGKHLLIFGAGAFTLTSILGFSFLLNILLRDIFISQQMAPIQNFWITQVVVLLFFTGISWYAIHLAAKALPTTPSTTRKLFFISVGIFVLSQVLQTLYTIFGSEYIIQKYMVYYIQYFDVINAAPALNTYNSLLILLKYLIFGILIYTGYKKFNPPAHRG